MTRPWRTLGRSLSRGLGRGRFHGIRFRLGLAMALALLPIILLSLVQTQTEFRRLASEQRQDLQLAAARSAAGAKGRIDSTTVLLQALAPEGVGLYCGPRLSALVQRLDGIDAFYRLSPTGQEVCASAGAASLGAAAHTAWFQRLRDGADFVSARAPGSPSLILAVRSERPMGAFQGATAASIPLAALRPDVADPALPSGAQAAVIGAGGVMFSATDADAFDLKRPPLAGWLARLDGHEDAVLEARDKRGRRMIYAGAPLAGRDVYVLLAAPAPHPLSWARLNPIGVLLLPLAAWLTAFSAVMLVSERVVVRWLDYLERIAAIYARGRFSVRPIQAENAPAEIRTLAHTLDVLGDTITRRDSALTDSLAEKDALLREIHHRVKNNLQIISSLLSMQQRAVADPAARAALGDTRQRITALALIYRTLYQGDDIRYADARVFLTELVGQLVAGEAMRGPLVTSSVDADSLVVDPDKLAPLALWLVEAVSNAQKHAFAGRGGDLQVRFRVNGDTSVLEVQDNGPGLHGDMSAGVGRTLMSAFAKQLRGTAEMLEAPGGGSIARLTFLTPEAQRPTDPSDLRPRA